MSYVLPCHSNVWGSDGRNGAFVSDSWSGVLSDTITARRTGDRNAARTATIRNVSANERVASRGRRGPRRRTHDTRVGVPAPATSWSVASAPTA